MRRTLRNLFVVCHVLAITVLAVPGPATFSRKFLDAPASRAEIGGWVDRLAGVVTEEQFVDAVYAVGNGLANGRNMVRAPFVAYGAWTGATQGWRMFTFIERSPSSLEIEVELRGRWRPIYRPRTSLDWKAGLLEQERVRAIMTAYSWNTRRTSWDDFAAWIAREAAKDFPGATRIRVQMRKVRSPSPEDVLAGRIAEGEVGQVREFSR